MRRLILSSSFVPSVAPVLSVETYFSIVGREVRSGQRSVAEPWYFHCLTCFEGHLFDVVVACGSGTVVVGRRWGHSKEGGRQSGPGVQLAEQGAFGVLAHCHWRSLD